MFILTPKKQCTKCGEWKDRGEFYKNKSRKDGLQSNCKVCHYKTSRDWVSRNTDRVRGLRRESWARNFLIPEKREKTLARRRKYYSDNTELLRENNKRWAKKNPLKWREYRSARRARERNASGRMTAREWEELKRFYNFTCLSCGATEPYIQLQPDHVKPLAKGGSNSIGNIQPLCPTCNNKKGTKEIDYR